KFPAWVLKIDMPPSDVDVNVSPSKTEVRFANERAIFETVYLAVKNGILNGENKKEISVSGKSLQISPKKDESFAEDTALQISSVYSVPKDSVYSVSRDKDIKDFIFNEQKESLSADNISGDTSKSYDEVENDTGKNPPDSIKRENRDISVRLDSYKSIYKPLPPKNIFIQEIIEEEPEKKKTEDYKFINQNSFIRAGSEEEKNLQTPDPIIEEKYKPQLKYIGELFKTYIVCECGDEMILIDKHAAHERIRFEQLKKDMKAASQLLTDGIRITLSLEEITALSDNLNYLEELGMDLSFLSDTELEILGFPSVITNRSPEDTVQKIAEILINGGDNIEGELFDDFLHSVACKGAIKAHEATSDKELEQLAKRVWEDQAIRYCPHGRPIITTLSKYNIERNFGRIQ
ncbi:MAG: hypothetical protein K2N36_05625, partial [Ruminiclostridium sp.]|nr:hypothetical protein [Ruminiclostridium sp.]